MSTQLATQALHAGHDAKKTQEHKQFLFIKQPLMCLIIQITLLICFH